MSELNPQAEQMADESMIRTLSAQAEAIWPQEQHLLDRYDLPDAPHILDAGCGTGELSSRLAEHFLEAHVLGVDIIDAHLAMARKRYAHLSSRLTFEHRSVFGLELPGRQFDLTVCRHVIHAIPYPERVLAELIRVTKPNGYLHLIPEDYGMLHFERGRLDPQHLWRVVSNEFGPATGTDMLSGRHAFRLLSNLGLEDIRVDYVVVDTVRVPRETFAAILEAWRDGFAKPIGDETSMSYESALEHFEQMIANVRDPHGYAAWMVPVVSARLPLR